jgi:four helix bundle protein
MGDLRNRSIVAQKSYAFALEIVLIYKFLVSDRKEYVLSKQLLRAGTSIGANVNEAFSAESKKDFIHKLAISLKEAKETLYWLDLLKDSNYLSEEQYFAANELCTEIIKILTRIILTTKEKYLTHNS